MSDAGAAGLLEATILDEERRHRRHVHVEVFTRLAMSDLRGAQRRVKRCYKLHTARGRNIEVPPHT